MAVYGQNQLTGQCIYILLEMSQISIQVIRYLCLQEANFLFILPFLHHRSCFKRSVKKLGQKISDLSKVKGLIKNKVVPISAKNGSSDGPRGNDEGDRGRKASAATADSSGASAGLGDLWPEVSDETSDTPESM